MSLPLNDECPTCFGYVGMTARMMGEKHRCTCPDPDEERVRATVDRDLRFTIEQQGKAKAA